jgi:hypothetical protein
MPSTNDVNFALEGRNSRTDEIALPGRLIRSLKYAWWLHSPRGICQEPEVLRVILIGESEPAEPPGDSRGLCGEDRHGMFPRQKPYEQVQRGQAVNCTMPGSQGLQTFSSKPKRTYESAHGLGPTGRAVTESLA